VSEIDNILATLKKQEVEYDLGTSDFAVTIDDAKNGTVDVQLLQRNFKYESCIIVGNNSIPKNTKGIVLFVSKSKYPCFIPFYFGTNSSENKHKPGTTDITAYKTGNKQDYPKGNFINLRKFLMDNGGSEGVHFKYRDSSPESQQWGTHSTISSIANIIKEWYLYCHDKDINSLFIPGDIAKVNGGPYERHEGIGHSTGRGIDCYTTDGLHISGNQYRNRSKLIALFDIFRNNGVKGVMWCSTKFDIVVNDCENHSNHFHVSFINLPF